VFSLLLAMLTAAASMASLIVFGFIGVTIEKPEIMAFYSTGSEILCDLEFESDPVYNENALEFGDGYVTRFVKSAALSFLYRFECADASDLEGSYSVSAVLEANHSGKLLWKKNYLLIPEAPLTGSQMTDSSLLSLEEYRDMAADISAHTGVAAPAVLTVVFTVNARAVAGGVPVSDTLVSTLIIDLSKDVLELGGEPKQERTSAAVTMKTRELIPKSSAILLSSLFLFFSLSACIFLYLFTFGFRDDPVRTQLRRLHRRYGRRMALLCPGSGIAKRDIVFVQSFRDLLLTSDRLRKPILCSREGEPADAEYYVIGDSELYCFHFASRTYASPD
jgi:hypothetical protein